MKRPRLVAGFVLILVFTLGAVAGGGIVRWQQLRVTLAQFDEAPDLGPRRALQRVLEHRLELDPDQLVRIEALLEAQSLAMREIRRRVEPDAAVIRGGTVARIREVLRPEQQPRFEEIVQAHEARLRSWLAIPTPSDSKSDTP